MEKVELRIIALTNNESGKGSYVLILEEENGVRRLPIVIGPFEAQAIAIAIEQIPLTRPLTHDLFKNTLDAAGITIDHIFINRLLDGAFHAALVGKKADKQYLEVDSRSSDAIALAVRFGCPIYTTEAILREAGIMTGSVEINIKKTKKSLTDLSIQELEKLLEKALKNENYEQAAKIRDAIDNKNEEN